MAQFLSPITGGLQFRIPFGETKNKFLANFYRPIAVRYNFLWYTLEYIKVAPWTFKDLIELFTITLQHIQCGIKSNHSLHNCSSMFYLQNKFLKRNLMTGLVYESSTSLADGEGIDRAGNCEEGCKGRITEKKNN